MLFGIIFSVAGLLVLAFAADQFVKGAARLAVILRIAPVVVGAVVIGFGTSAPEMVVSGLAAARGDLDIGVGNIIGSNVANISLVLGVSSLVGVIGVSKTVVRRDAVASVISVVLFALAIQNGLARLEAAVLLVVLAGWLITLIKGRNSHQSFRTQDTSTGNIDDNINDDNINDLVGEDPISVSTETLRTFIGLALVISSAYVLVEGAQRIADALNISGGLVGYTLIAVGTSAPELVTAVAASRLNQTELLVGNLLGSNVFNSLAVGGLIGMVGAGTIQDSTLVTVGAALMVLICALSWLAMLLTSKVCRRDGIILIALWFLSVALLA